MITLIIRKDGYDDLLNARLPDGISIEQLIEAIFREVNRQNDGSTDS